MSQTLLSDVVVRMSDDPEFAARVHAGDEEALAGLSEEDRAQVMALGADSGPQGRDLAVRLSKSAILGGSALGALGGAHAPADIHVGAAGLHADSTHIQDIHVVQHLDVSTPGLAPDLSHSPFHHSTDAQGHAVFTDGQGNPYPTDGQTGHQYFVDPTTHQNVGIDPTSGVPVDGNAHLPADLNLDRGGPVALNPQPIPPGITDGANAHTVAPVPPGVVPGVDPHALALNPQPEPPGVTPGADAHAVALNPQPEPPGVTPGVDAHALTLNPQPEPPGVTPGVDAHALALNPQPEPPGVTEAPAVLGNVAIAETVNPADLHAPPASFGDMQMHTESQHGTYHTSINVGQLQNSAIVNANLIHLYSGEPIGVGDPSVTTAGADNAYVPPPLETSTHIVATYHHPDGSTENDYDNGDHVVHNPDGSQYIEHPTGETIVIQPNGDWTDIPNTGDHVLHLHGGGISYIHADGTSDLHDLNGVVHHLDAKSVQVGVTFQDGTSMDTGGYAANTLHTPWGTVGDSTMQSLNGSGHEYPYVAYDLTTGTQVDWPFGSVGNGVDSGSFPDFPAGHHIVVPMTDSSGNPHGFVVYDSPNHAVGYSAGGGGGLPLGQYDYDAAHAQFVIDNGRYQFQQWQTEQDKYAGSGGGASAGGGW